MLRSTIRVDLPSEETLRRHSLFGLLRSALGRDSVRSGREELTISGMQVIEAIMLCLGEAGVRDAISLVVDGHRVFVDYEGVENDLDGLLRAAGDSHLMQGSFGTLRLVAEHRSETLHTLVALHVTKRVELGQKEMVISLAARPIEIVHQAGETAKTYAERLVAFTQSDGLQGAFAEFDELGQAIAKAFRKHVHPLEVESTTIDAILVRPSTETIHQFPGLDFGEESRQYEPALSATQRHPDRYHRYYVDRLYAFFSYVLIRAMIQTRAWRFESLQIIFENGASWATGESLHEESCEAWDAIDDIDFDEAGNVVHVHRSATSD